MARTRLPTDRNVGDAINHAPTLAALLAGHRRAQACFEQVLPALPPMLHSLVRPGPIDGTRWTLFAQNSSAAAKLRQLLPDLLAALHAREPGITEIKAKIQPRDPAAGSG
jgi:Dna[CI] antecedent, DciA